MNFPTITEVPLRQAIHGVILVGDTRVPLDTVLWWFNQGDSPEDIVQHFTSLKLADVYAVIGYYLQHREEVDAYLRKRTEELAQIRAEVEAQQPVAEWRARLLAIRNQK